MDCNIKKIIALVIIGCFCCQVTIISDKRLQLKNPKIKYSGFTDSKLKNKNKLEASDPFMEQTISARKEKLKQSCKSIKEQEIKNNFGIPPKILDKWHQYSVCRIPKAGIKAWAKLSKYLRKQNIKKGNSTYIIPARHPLDRLFSVYKDKFLGGSPIYAYDNQWRKDTGSSETFVQRWQFYWFPALMSSHRLAPQFSSLSKSLVKYRNSISSTERSYHDTSSCIGKMIKKHYPKFGSLPTSPDARYKNVSFTFEEFISHVIWTHDIGCVNRHWQLQHILCAACVKHVDYVLHMETSSMEVPYILNKLGFEIDTFGRVHKSFGIADHNDYEEYFKSLDNQLFVRVKTLYENDMAMFY